MARWAIQAEPMVIQTVGILFLEPGDSFISNQSFLTKALHARFGERALMKRTIFFDLSNCLGE